MKTVREWVDKTHEVADSLEDKAHQIHTKKIEAATAYKDGYIQACEDFAREMRRAISENQG